MLVSDVLALSAATLNDVSRTRMTYTVMLPYFRMAYQELQDNILENHVQISDEIAAALTVTAGMKAITSSSTPALPTDLLSPIKLEEKLTSKTIYHPMTQVDFEPTDDPELYMGVWAFRENELKFRGSTANLNILITYQRKLDTISTEASTLTIPQAAAFLQFRTAELCARFVNEDNPRADALQTKAEKALETYLSTEIHGKQSLSVRRKPFRRTVSYGRI